MPDVLMVEGCAKATLEQGGDGAYIARFDELVEFAGCLERSNDFQLCEILASLKTVLEFEILKYEGGELAPALFGVNH
jgi:hypothetical protein